ncbi:unnamed protein product [Didymodactylos carnosus]|uniref:Uncharacterized protein n=1 Tax=Didymodactylos carnosus TaxID=1234261 RepID=A0A814PBN6_9BILA|nr:unnamed protein product [Didymodactylos carnosus]CAF3868779.1 unnamed protein product [Didymodactylos carnosus]
MATNFFRTAEIHAPLDKRVYYHDNGRWQGYRTAKDVEFGTMQSSNFNPGRESAIEHHDVELDPLSVEEEDDSFNTAHTTSQN